MAYITLDQLRIDYSARELLQLSDRNSSNIADEVVLQRAIDRAAAMIDAELSRCYVLPITPRPPRSVVPEHVLLTLSEWNGRIARYLLWDDQRGNGADPKADSEPTRRYKEVMSRLKDCDPSKDCGCELFADLALNPRAAAAAGGAADSVVFGDSGSRFGRGEFTHGARDATQWGSVTFPDQPATAAPVDGDRDELVQGETFNREWDWATPSTTVGVPDTPINITGYSGTFTLHRSDNNAVVHTGMLTLVDAVNGKFGYTMAGSVTAALAAGDYWYRVMATGPAPDYVSTRLDEGRVLVVAA